MISWLRLIVALLGLIPAAAFADGNLHWRCWYDQQVYITCLVDNVPGNNDGASQAALPANLPGIVRQMRQDPGAFRNRFVQIPLHSIPYEMEFTAQLARATVCGSRRDCTVNFTATLPAAAEIAALLNKHQPGIQRELTTLLAMASQEED